mmetsp:Transcript_12028/g.26723  ORF Transcript_12028/g.26723 Transcript_12028/m.26723 type:complete len:583 (+) Transcript_12028:90-1838(+)
MTGPRAMASDHSVSCTGEALERLWESMSIDAKLRTLRFEDPTIVERAYVIQQMLWYSELICPQSGVGAQSRGGIGCVLARGFDFSWPEPNAQRLSTLPSLPTAFSATRQLVLDENFFSSMTACSTLSGSCDLTWASIFDPTPTSWAEYNCQVCTLVELALVKVLEAEILEAHAACREIAPDVVCELAATEEAKEEEEEDCSAPTEEAKPETRPKRKSRRRKKAPAPSQVKQTGVSRVTEQESQDILASCDDLKNGVLHSDREGCELEEAEMEDEAEEKEVLRPGSVLEGEVRDSLPEGQEGEETEVKSEEEEQQEEEEEEEEEPKGKAAEPNQAAEVSLDSLPVDTLPDGFQIGQSAALEMDEEGSKWETIFRRKTRRTRQQEKAADRVAPCEGGGIATDNPRGRIGARRSSRSPVRAGHIRTLTETSAVTTSTNLTLARTFSCSTTRSWASRGSASPRWTDPPTVRWADAPPAISPLEAPPVWQGNGLTDQAAEWLMMLSQLPEREARVAGIGRTPLSTEADQKGQKGPVEFGFGSEPQESPVVTGYRASVRRTFLTMEPLFAVEDQPRRSRSMGALSTPW